MKQGKFRKYILSSFMLLMLLLVGCSKDENGGGIGAPEFKTQEALEITRTTAKLSGEVYASDGQSFECGFLYATVSTVPTKDALKVRGEFTDTYLCQATLGGLKPNTTYYYCMYASNGASMVRSQEIRHFSTKEDGTPILDDVSILSIGESSLTVSSRIIDEGGSEMRQFGFAYKATNEDKYTYVYTTEFVDKDTKTYQLTIEKLEPETSYMIKAIASNTRGEGSGKETTQVTSSLESPVVTTQEVINITATSCVVTGILEMPGKGTIFERGFMISVKGSSEVPRVVKVDAPLSDKTFMETIGELKPNTTYLVYAYAKSTLLTKTLMGQGGAKEFVTLERKVPQLSGVACNSIDAASNLMIVTAHVTDVGNGTIRKCGFYYSTTNKNPSASDQQLECTLVDNNSIAGTIAGLLKNRTYYVRAYAFNEEGVGLGGVAEFIPFPVKSMTLGNVGYSMNGDKMTLTSSVVNTGDGTVSERGFMWSTTTSELTNMTKLVAGGDNHLFTAILSDIQKDVNYHIRAYAVNEKGITYGELRTITPIELTVPTVDKASWTLAGTTLKLSSKVISTGNGTISERGFCWSKVTNDPSKMPRLNATSGNDAGFHVEVKDIEANASYYLCAYAKNEKGITYSSVEQMIPLSADRPEVGAVKGKIDGKTIVLSSTAVSKEKMLEVGFYYNTTGNPTQSSEFLSATPGEAFSATLKNLKVDVTYYICAYAKNIAGVTLGSVTSIESPLKVPSIGEPNIWSAVVTGTSIAISANIWSDNGTISAKGFCYSLTNKKPTLADGHVECTSDKLNAVIAGLEMGKTYYICAYATNESGTGYSNAVSLKTKKAPEEGDIESPDKNN